jgi:2-dehydropantoate 2-reductase
VSQPKIAVLGAGANGASIGADLAAAGVDVVLIEQWPEHVEAMRKNGIRIEMPNRTLTQDVRVFHLCDVATFRDRFDVVLMLMKAYDSRWAAHLIEPYLKPDGLLVGVQNGMTAETIAEVVGPNRTLGCVIEVSSMMWEPGVVERNSPPERSWFAVGSLHPSTRGREEEVASLLRHSGTVEIMDEILAAKWMKLVSNAATLVTTAILGLPMLEAARIPAMRRLMIRSSDEALQVGEAVGYPVLPIFGVTRDEMPDDSYDLAEFLLDTLLEGFVLPETKTTVLQDWMKGRRSEVHDINGNVVRLGAGHGVATPVNRAVVDVARRIEAGELRPDPDNLDILLAAVEG